MLSLVGVATGSERIATKVTGTWSAVVSVAMETDWVSVSSMGGDVGLFSGGAYTRGRKGKSDVLVVSWVSLRDWRFLMWLPGSVKVGEGVAPLTRVFTPLFVPRKELCAFDLIRAWLSSCETGS